MYIFFVSFQINNLPHIINTANKILEHNINNNWLSISEFESKLKESGILKNEQTLNKFGMYYF